MQVDQGQRSGRRLGTQRSSGRRPWEREGVDGHGATRERLRPEIQALRALAVAIVVGYHLWPRSLPGGFAGVDVFFAISGFLITSHLLREVERTGRVSVGAFWARRARRILPAALLTLSACALATIALVPETRWDQYLTEVRASALYVQNWHLAANSVDYLHIDDQPSPVQHFWSLAAEEQFYIVWPLLITAAAAAVVAARRTAAIAVVLGSVTIASVAYSLVKTQRDPSVAFFVTPTRAWEFGAGGLLALVARSGRRPRHAVSYAGLGAIAAATALYSETTPFPGVAAALPVGATLAVIWAAAPGRVLRARPVQFLGDISYSVYLWHWPLIVLIPIVTERALDGRGRMLVVVLTVLAAWITKRLVEDPARRGPLLARGPARWTLAAAAAATAVVLGLTSIGTSRLGDELRAARDEARRTLLASPPCLGAAARDTRRRCQNPRLRRTVVPSPLEAQRDHEWACAAVRRAGPQICAFGGRVGEPVALIGDSHAVHWRPALKRTLRSRHWRGLSFYQSACPFSAARANMTDSFGRECRQWNRDVVAWLWRHPEVRTIFTSQHRGAGVVAPPGMSAFEAQVDGFIRRWNALPPSVEQIVVLTDIPYSVDGTLDCIEDALAERTPPGPACAIPRSVALKPDPAAEAARRVGPPRLGVIDLNAYMCGRRRCEPVIGGVLVRRDIGHLTGLFARTLGPFLQRELDALSADR